MVNTRLSIACLALGLFLMGGLGGCGGRHAAPAAPTPSPAHDARASTPWTFRHKVRLELPQHGVTHSFDGLMRLDLAQQTIHVAALSGLGMQLFDLRIGPTGMEAAYVHPVLEKIPHATEHIAASIRRIWFDCFRFMPHTLTMSGIDWTVAASEDMVADLWPSVTRFVDTRAKYTLTVRLVQAQREETP